MSGWLSLALAFLKLVNAILDYAATERARNQGRDEEIARESAAILLKTGFAQKALTQFSGDPGAADDFLRSLEPPSK